MNFIFTLSKGATTKPIVKMLKVKIQAKEEINLFLEVNNKVMESVLGCVEELIDQKSFNYWRVREQSILQV